MKQPHVLLVERDPWLGELYQRKLAASCHVSVARDAQSAIDVLDAAPVDLVVMDVLGGKHNGVELLYEIRSYDDWLSTPIILLSSLPRDDFPIKDDAWLGYGIVNFLYKPSVKPEDLLGAVREALAT